jgi:ssDNA-binding Zn-finger/Zn-ribbon topoisomerase 1
MPTIDTFGMPTREANKACPACGVGMLVMKFDHEHGHMNRIACPVAGCAYDVPLKEFQSTLTEVLPVNCQNCGKPMVRTTKDLDSKFMGWVKCSGVGCANAMTFLEFKAARV